MKAIRVTTSIILWIISVPFLLSGLFGLCIYSLSNVIYKYPEDEDDYYVSGPHRGMPKN
jgi:hypothetical protein